MQFVGISAAAAASTRPNVPAPDPTNITAIEITSHQCHQSAETAAITSCKGRLFNLLEVDLLSQRWHQSLTGCT